MVNQIERYTRHIEQEWPEAAKELRETAFKLWAEGKLPWELNGFKEFGEPTIFRYKDFSFDPKTRNVKSNNGEAHLGYIGAKILQILIENAGKKVPTNDLSAAFEGTSEVRQHVNFLRSRLTAISAPIQVETRTSGYALIDPLVEKNYEEHEIAIPLDQTEIINVYRHPLFKYDFLQGVIGVGEKISRLEPKEAKLLGIMAERPNYVIPDDYFYRVVWGDEYKSVDVLKTQISKIRRKLREIGINESIIERSSGIGYRLIDSSKETYRPL